MNVMIRNRGRYGPVVSQQIESVICNLKTVIFSAPIVQTQILKPKINSEINSEIMIDLEEFLKILIDEHLNALNNIIELKNIAFQNEIDETQIVVTVPSITSLSANPFANPGANHVNQVMKVQ